MTAMNITEYLDSLENSTALYNRACKVEPAGVQGAGRYYSPRPIYMRRAKGGKIWDVDGNEYIDMHSAYGAVLLGHNDDRVLAAVGDVLKNEGILFALPHPREVELAETLVRLIPSAEKVIFTSEGTTAIVHAIRAGRAYSKKPVVLKFEGAYHGWADDINASVTPTPDVAGAADRPNTTGGSAGRMPEALDNVITAPWNNLQATLEIAYANKDRIGVVIVEPVMRFIMPVPGFLEGIRALCDEIGAVLIFDEVFSGFKAGVGCAQSIFNVIPDITVIGKAMANGFALSSAVGKSEIMSLMAPQGPVFFSGTFSGILLSVAASQKVIQIYEEEDVPNKVSKKGDEFARRINDGIAKIGIPAHLSHWRCVWHMFFRETPPQSFRDVIGFVKSDQRYPGPKLAHSYVHYMLANGVYLQPYFVVKGNLNFGHSEADFEKVIRLTLNWLNENGSEIEKVAKIAG